MKNFSYDRAGNVDEALQLASHNANAKFLGGGTNLVDLMRENIEAPDALVDVTWLSGEIETTTDGAIRIGAGVKNTALANHLQIRSRFPVLAQAILFGASGQIRNMATVGGNILQRTRCYYFYDLASRCNKREPGSGCDALGGFNRIHAILGASNECIATHPSDMCVALAALDATIHVEGPSGKRAIKFNDFYRLPGDTPQIETDLQAGELITYVSFPNDGVAVNSMYRKVRDRSSYAFALVSVAAALEVEDNKIKSVRIALGGVAHKPWRAFAAEEVLLGASPTEENFKRAAEAELKDARGYADNNFKIELAKRTIVGTLKDLLAGATSGATQ